MKWQSTETIYRLVSGLIWTGVLSGVALRYEMGEGGIHYFVNPKIFFHVDKHLIFFLQVLILGLERIKLLIL